jgi:hypothetical protein
MDTKLREEFEHTDKVTKYIFIFGSLCLLTLISFGFYDYLMLGKTAAPFASVRDAQTATATTSIYISQLVLTKNTGINNEIEKINQGLDEIKISINKLYFGGSNSPWIKFSATKNPDILAFQETAYSKYDEFAANIQNLLESATTNTELSTNILMLEELNMSYLELAEVLDQISIIFQNDALVFYTSGLIEDFAILIFIIIILIFLLMFHNRRVRQRKELLRGYIAIKNDMETLRSIIPICSYCHKIRHNEEANNWAELSNWLSENTSSSFSHGVCPSCIGKMDDEEIILPV